MPTGVRIRDAVPGDAPVIAEVHARSWVDTYGICTASDGSWAPSVDDRAATWHDRLTRVGAGEHLLVAQRDAGAGEDRGAGIGDGQDRGARGDEGVDRGAGVGDDGLVGFAWVGPTTDGDDDPASVGQIRSLHVLPDEQGHGLGRSLLAAARDRLASSGYQRLSLWVVRDNLSARTFYEQQGWEPDGTTRQEKLAMPGEPGPVVTVVRYRAAATPPRQRGDD